jgi:16S rRNA (guanine527-N7)-methyltransferase
LPALLESVAPLCGAATCVLAMKGRRPDAELAALPAGWEIVRVTPLVVPGLDEDRHLVELRRAHATAHSTPGGLR